MILCWNRIVPTEVIISLCNTKPKAQYYLRLMAGNSFGTLFRLTTFGESHGKAIGGVLDGCPAGLNIDFAFIQKELDRRKPGQSAITTQRKESDSIEILAGVFDGKSTGAPIAFLMRNEDQKSEDYDGGGGEVQPVKPLRVLREVP